MFLTGLCDDPRGDGFGKAAVRPSLAIFGTKGSGMLVHGNKLRRDAAKCGRTIAIRPDLQAWQTALSPCSKCLRPSNFQGSTPASHSNE